MKLIRSSKARFVFEISAQEKHLLFEVLSVYPLVPPTHHRLNKSSQRNNRDENQRLLEESLLSQRKENQKLVTRLLNKSEIFETAADGFRFTLTRAEIETLLQALNDVRVGSWIALGSPDLEERPQLAINEKTARHIWAMELAGEFEMLFLSSVDGRDSAG